MQIHEITLIQEGMLGTIGSDIKNAVTSPFKKAAAVAGTPGAMTSAGGYASAMNKYYQDDNARLQTQQDQRTSDRLAAQTQQRAKELAQQWLQQLKSKQPTGPIKAAPSSPTPLKPTGKYATNKNAGQVVDPTPAGLISEATPGAPTPTELAKFQQRLAAASAPKTGFGGLPGAKPAPGGAVDIQPTKNVLTGTRANEFKSWVDKQLTSQVTGTNQTVSMAQVRQDPKVAQQLAQLLPAIIMKNDPAAIEQYLTIAMTAMQQLSAQIRQSQKSSRTPGTAASEVSPLSMILNPGQIEALQNMFQDPVKGAAAKRKLGIK
jgi:hypothetical protein